MSGIAWSDEEVQIIRSMYSRMGARKTLEKLEDRGFARTLHSIQNKAHRLGLVSGITKDAMSLNEALEIILGYSCISHRARQQWRRFFMDIGVLSYIPDNKVKWTIKENVVYEIADKIADDNDMKHSGEWFTINEAAKHYNVGPSYLRRCMQDKRYSKTLLGRQMKKVCMRRTFLQNHWYLNAEDVKRTAAEYERIQHAKKQKKLQARRSTQGLQVRVPDPPQQGKPKVSNDHGHAHLE